MPGDLIKSLFSVDASCGYPGNTLDNLPAEQ